MIMRQKNPLQMDVMGEKVLRTSTKERLSNNYKRVDIIGRVWYK